MNSDEALMWQEFAPLGVWFERQGGAISYDQIQGKGKVIITLESVSPTACYRGDFIAKIFALDPISCYIDDADGWPRYYLDKQVARSEIETFLRRRNLLPEDETLYGKDEEKKLISDPIPGEKRAD